MIYQGVCRDGVIVLRGEVDLAEGQVVEVLPKGRPRGKAKAPKTARKQPVTDRARSKRPASKPPRPSRERRVEALRAAFGMWKDRPEWQGMTAVEITAELRRRALGRVGDRRG
jgi:hypothetical protein